MSASERIGDLPNKSADENTSPGTGAKSLVLFTRSFPYGAREHFLSDELRVVAPSFLAVWIVPLSCDPRSPARDVPPNARVLPPLFPGRGGAVTRAIATVLGLANVAAVRPFVLRLGGSPPLRARAFFRSLRGAIAARYLLSRRVVEKRLSAAGDDVGLLYFYWGTVGALISPFLERIGTGPRRIVRLHGGDLYETPRPWRRPLPYQRALLESVDRAIAVSAHGRDDLASRYPDLASRFEVSRLATRDRGLSRASEDGCFRIVSCSYVVASKRVGVLLDGLSHLARYTARRIHWTHIGGGPLATALARKARAALPPHVTFTFLGDLAHEDALAHYTRHPSDLFVSTSAAEGIPVAILEALSFGVPVFATDVGGVRELVDAAVGELLPEGVTGDELMARVLRFVSLAPEERALVREAARERWQERANAATNYARLGVLLRSMAEEENADPLSHSVLPARGRSDPDARS